MATDDEPRSSTPSALLPRPLPVVLAIYAAFNVLAPILMALVGETLTFEHVIMMTLAILAFAAGEIGFLSVWAVWGPQPAMTRNAVSLLAAVVAYLLIVFVAAWVAPGVYKDDPWSVLFLPLMFFSVQLPQWVLKFALGSHLSCRRPPPASAGDARRFSIGQLLAAMGLVAASLAAARLGNSLVGIGDEAAGGPELLTLFVLVFGVCSGFLLVLPSFWAILMARRVGLGIAVLIVYGILLSTVTAYLLSVVPWDATVFLAVFVALGGALAGLCASLGALRRCGYSVCRVEQRPEVIGLRPPPPPP